MKKTVQRISKCKAFWGMLALVLVLGAGLFAGDLAIVSHAESAAKVTASSAKIRKSVRTLPVKSSEVRPRIRQSPSRVRPRVQTVIPGMKYMWMRIRWDIFVPTL